VNGVELNSCLGDLYSVSWMENSDAAGPSETLETQFLIVQNLTTESHVMQYGDQTWTSEVTGDYIGEGGKKHKILAAVDESPENKPLSHVNSRDIPMHLAYYKYLRAERFSPEATEALANLRAQLDAREAAEQRFLKLSQLLALDRSGKQIHTPAHYLNEPKTPIISGPCIKGAVEALEENGCGYDDFSLQFHKVIVNACRQHSTEESGLEFVTMAILQVCQGGN